MNIADITNQDVIDWCFDDLDLPELDADPVAARAALVTVITSLNSSFAAHKASYEEATSHRLDADEYRRVRVDYHDWKRRATHIKKAVEDRLREVKADLANRPEEGLTPDQMIQKIRYIHRVLDDFVRELDDEAKAS